MGLSDGHGRVLMFQDPTHRIEVDTRTQRIAKEFNVEEEARDKGADGPSPPWLATPEGAQRLSTGNTVEIPPRAHDQGAPEAGPKPAQLIERNTDGKII